MPETISGQRLLAIECTTEACSVALFEQGRLLAGEWAMLGRGHAEALVPMIARLPDQGRAERIAVGRGPGSFTGVRIGLAAAQALGLAWNAELLTYPTLALIAAMAKQQAGAAATLVATTGGHGEWFVQPFDEAGHPLATLASLSPEQAALQPDLYTGSAMLITGSQAEALAARRAALNLPTGEVLPLWPDARRILTLPDTAFSTDLTPLYGRTPDARLPG